MITVIRQHIDQIPNHDHKIYRVREILQLLVLSLLGQQGFFSHCCFVGGTALRICHGLQRYSEDLDFSLKDTAQRDESTWERLLYGLSLHGLTFEHTLKTGTVQSCMLKFPQLLYELGLSGYATQKVQIKCEVDSNPPLGAERETEIVNDIYLFPLEIYTLSSLMSGKVHALLCRGFIKGRDRYDLVWYLTKAVQPNIKLLNNALVQTDYPDTLDHRDAVVTALIQKLDTITTQQLLDDVGVFLENDTQRALLDITLIRTLLQKSKQS